jgi:hypothetical protein
MEAKIRNLHGQQNPSPSSQQNPAQIQQNPPQGKRNPPPGQYNPPPAKQNPLHAKQIPPKKAKPRNPQEQKNAAHVKEEAKMLQKGPRG